MSAMFHVSSPPRLTRGQLQVAERFILGETSAEIGKRFGISSTAVESALHGARQRLGARNGPHLAALLVAYGIVEPDHLRLANEAARALGIAGARP